MVNFCKKILAMLGFIKKSKQSIRKTKVIKPLCEHTWSIHPVFGDEYCTKCYIPKGLAN